MTQLPTEQPSKSDFRFCLKFLSGPLTGLEVDLVEGMELVFGRARDCQLQIRGHRVSRHHAKLRIQSGEGILEDLNSANGTFVNGRRQASSRLKLGDRFQVGDDEFEYNVGADPEEAGLTLVESGTEETVWEGLTVGEARRQAAMLSGKLEEVPLFDLIQMLSNMRRSGVLRLTRQNRLGEIHLRDGRLFHVCLDGGAAVRPEKTLFRLLGWKEGLFAFLPSRVPEPPVNLAADTGALLLEAAQAVDKLAELADRLPQENTPLALVRPFPMRWSEMESGDLDTLQILSESKSVEVFFNTYPADDDLAASALLRFLGKGWAVLGTEP